MRFRDLQFRMIREEFRVGDTDSRRSRKDAYFKGNRSQYLCEDKRCVGYAIQISDDEWAFFRYGPLGKDVITRGLTKLELAAIIAPMETNPVSDA
jgi:hypothetical protein